MASTAKPWWEYTKEEQNKMTMWFDYCDYKEDKIQRDKRYVSFERWKKKKGVK